jgi:dihydrofolate reductase
MHRVTVVNHVSLDGVMQAPGRRDEDPRGGFAHGGWPQAGNDPVMAEGMGRGTALLLGRRTDKDFAGYWPRQTDNPFTPVLDAKRKYVASRTLTEAGWSNTTVLGGDSVTTRTGVVIATYASGDA